MDSNNFPPTHGPPEDQPSVVPTISAETKEEMKRRLLVPLGRDTLRGLAILAYYLAEREFCEIFSGRAESGNNDMVPNGFVAELLQKNIEDVLDMVNLVRNDVLMDIEVEPHKHLNVLAITFDQVVWDMLLYAELERLHLQELRNGGVFPGEGILDWELRRAVPYNNALEAILGVRPLDQ